VQVEHFTAGEVPEDILAAAGNSGDGLANQPGAKFRKRGLTDNPFPGEGHAGNAAAVDVGGCLSDGGLYLG